MIKVFTKIKNNPTFKIDPDKAVREFTLPHNKKTMVEMLGDYVAVKFYSSTTKDGTTKTHRHYHYSQGGKLLKCLGNADDITFLEAYEKSRHLIKDSATTDLIAPKNTLARLFKEYCESKVIAPLTLKKHELRFRSRLGHLADKRIDSITKKDILHILEPINKEQKYALLKDLFYLVKALFDFARIRDLTNNSLFQGENFGNYYKIPKSDGYSFISDKRDLRALIYFVTHYRHQTGVKNALIFGLLTGLRSANVRYLSHKHLHKSDDGEYYLLFPKEENKIKDNGDEYLGLPKEVGDWLNSIKRDGCQFFFPNTEGNELCDAALSKALRNYYPTYKNTDDKIVFHSFRKILETFTHEEKENNGLDSYDIERTIFHKVAGVAGVYNKATNVKNTRKVLT